MQKNVVLIDFESVQPDSIDALNHEYFQVLLFCGANQTKIPFEIAAALQKLGSRAEYVKISGSGPNALDFHIAFYIGRLSAQDPETSFHIVSRDKGFDPLIQHLNDQKIYSVRSESITDIPTVKTGAKKSSPEAQQSSSETPKSSTERAERFISKLKKPKATKPQTEKTMRSAIKTHFQAAIDEHDVDHVLNAMVATGFISIDAGKIVYAQTGA